MDDRGAGRGAYPGRVDEQAAGRELEAAIGEALWRYAEAVTGLGRDAAGKQGPRLAGSQMYLARLAGTRRARQALADAETTAAAAAIECGTTYPMLARGRDGPPDRVETIPAPLTSPGGQRRRAGRWQPAAATAPPRAQ